MPTPVRTILNSALRKPDSEINVLTFPTHERYQTNLAETGANFYLWQEEGIKPWVDKYGSVPKNTVLLNPEKQDQQIPLHVDIDLVLSQNKFGQFGIAQQVADQMGVPLISLEHTLPMESWSDLQLKQLYNMRGEVNVFISDYSMKRWGWNKDESMVIHHGIDTELFSPSDQVKKEPMVLSVVNDWINRDWCCGYRLWENITEYPNSSLPLQVIGDTEGLSKPAKSTKDLVNEYRMSRIFLNTSLISPIPTSLLEAMSCGCAIVTTETCMIPDIIVNGKNGYMSNDPKKLRSFIDNLLQDEGLAQELGKNARKTIVDNFSLNKFVDAWKNLFLSVVEQRNG